MQIRFIPDFIFSHTIFYCPKCREKMRVVYIGNQSLVCDNCKEAWALYLRKQKEIDYEKIVEDGWGKKETANAYKAAKEDKTHHGN